jgi:hypothetical protein
MVGGLVSIFYFNELFQPAISFRLFERVQAVDGADYFF